VITLAKLDSTQPNTVSIAWTCAQVHLLELSAATLESNTASCTRIGADDSSASTSDTSYKRSVFCNTGVSTVKMTLSDVRVQFSAFSAADPVTHVLSECLAVISQGFLLP